MSACDEARLSTQWLLALVALPRWTAWMNGALAAIVPVNHFVPGVFVGAGEQRIELECTPHSYRVGLTLTIACAAVSMVLASWWRSPGAVRNGGSIQR